MKIVLVHTGISRCGFNSYGTSQESSWISHGLCSISASAKKAGHDVNFIDLRRLSGWGAYEDRLKQIDPDVIGLTMMTVDFEVVKTAVHICKGVLPNTKIVVGGPHASIMPDDVLEMSEIDYVIQGEAETGFVDLIETISRGDDYPRLSRADTPDLDAIPFSDRSLYPEPETPFHPAFSPPFVTLITGRGCIYNCSFCQPAERRIFGRKVRRRSIDNVIMELKLLRESVDFKSFMIHDDCFTEDQDYVNKFCKRLIKEGFTQNFVCQTRADIICKHAGMIKNLRDASCRMFSIGFESGNDRILKLLRKGVKAEENYRAAEICRELGILIDANYMLGMPTETEDEMMDTVRMINKINPEIRSPSFFTPHPGTDLYDYCLKKDLLLMKDYSQFRRNPYGQKIKDVDYKLVRRMLWLSRGPFRPSHILHYISDHPGLYKTMKWVAGTLKFQRK